MVCFDKTGTLTENRMDLYGCLMTTGNKFDQMPIEADNETY
jgi:P-type E1-E2 ATPase